LFRWGLSIERPYFVENFLKTNPVF